MKKGVDFLKIGLALCVGIFFQVLFVLADTADTPNKAVIGFSKAYFKLDPSMSRFLCDDLVSNEDRDVVSEFLHKTGLEAQDRGFGSDYLKSYLYHITTYTISRSEDTAKIRIHCKRRKSINPVFAIVAKIFFIGNTYTVDEVIDLVKEEGKWKICGAPFSLT